MSACRFDAFRQYLAKRKFPKKPKSYEPSFKKMRIDDYDITDRDVDMLDTCFSNSLVIETDSGIAKKKKNNNNVANSNPFQSSYILLPSNSNQMNRPFESVSEHIENVISCLEPFGDEMFLNIEKKYAIERELHDEDENEIENEPEIKSDNNNNKKKTSHNINENNPGKKRQDFINCFFDRTKTKPDPHRNFDDFVCPKGN